MSWHQTPLAARLIADAFRLSAMSESYAAIARAGDGIFHADDTSDAIGTLERQGRLFGLTSSSIGAWTGSGLISAMLDRLNDLRDAWIDVEHRRRLRAGGIERATEAADEVHEIVTADADTVTFAIDAWVQSQRRRAA
jgi:hypothetical protein